MTEETTRNGDIEIVYEALGPTDGEPLLLVTGISGQLIDWPDGLCELLVERGFRVARLDNRDAGRSTHLTDAGRPSQLKMLLRPASAAVYRLEDMADDAVAVMDALGWTSAHLAGFSQGGMIAQTMAVGRPDRVRSLTSICSTPAPRLGQPKPATLLKMIKVANPKRVKDREGMAQYVVDLHALTGSPAYPTDEARLREHGRLAFDRGGADLAAVQRQTAAIAASGDRRSALARVRVPARVLHGEGDRLIRPEAGRATAAAIPGARLVTYPGMGHELPRELWPAFVDEISQLADVAARSR
jgi:pimeloyl-ACP methyl ester carboxylesterase